MDKVSAGISTVFNQVFDQEPLNYLEAAGLFGIVANGRQNMAYLEVLYNHAHDSELKNLLKQAIEDQTEWLVDKAEHLLQTSHGRLPALHFVRRQLHDN